MLFLIGFMGSGKTHWGKIWANSNGLVFYDLDELVEKKEGRSVSTIFEKDGEDYFRKAETACLHTIPSDKPCIVACGGGAACFNDNMQWMNEHGTTLYLATTASDILTRVKDEKNKRPLINRLNEAELLFFIEQKLKERIPFYTQAKITLQADELHAGSLQFLNLKQ